MIKIIINPYKLVKVNFFRKQLEIYYTTYSNNNLSIYINDLKKLMTKGGVILVLIP